MKRPRAKKFNKFKKGQDKHRLGNGKPEPEAPRELPKNDMEAKIHLITQDIKFAQALAGNDKKVRDKFLKNLKKWLNTRSNASFPFSDDDFLRLWKGLFYCMWMSDKPLIQEQLCEDMGSLFYCFDKPEIAVQFYGRFLETISQEWLGIDHWRLDKFMMLVRRVTRHLFGVLNKHEWNVELLKQLRKEITGTVLKQGVLSFGCTMHFIDLFWEEVAKVSEGKISTKSITGLVRPFLAFLTDTQDQRLSKKVVVGIFYQLLKQSDMGRQHEEKYEVWKQFGFPSERIDDMQLVENEEAEGEEEDQEEEEEEEEDEAQTKIPADSELPPETLALDPRAGNVSVVLAEIPFNARKIYELMEKAIYDAGTRSVNRKVIKKIMAHFEKYIAGEYPLGIKRVNLPSTEAAKLPNIEEKAQELDALEDTLMEESRLMKTLSKVEKKRFYSSGMTPRDYLESLGKITDDTNGMVVVEEIEEEVKEAPKKQQKKRKSQENGSAEGSNNQNKKKLKKSSNNESLDSSIDNGFEVEELPSSAAEEVQQQKKATKSKAEKAETNGNAAKEQTTPSKKKKTQNGGAVFDVESDWDKPLQEGEIEYTVTPTKQRLKHLNGELDDRPVIEKVVKNPFATNGSATKKQKKGSLAAAAAGVPASPRTPVQKLGAVSALGTPNSSGKRVKIMLEKNMAQEKSEYFRQLRNSPQIPFDSEKKPTKGLLKPHSMPSPINPYYKKKIGLVLDSEE